jgi:hypothetical protein
VSGEALAERGHITRGGFGPPISYKPDHRHRRLLCARRKRPRGCAAEQSDELAPFQLVEVHSIPASRDQTQEYRIGEGQSAGIGAFPRAVECRHSAALI